MSTIWKIVIGLVLTLPIAAYVVGSLVASTAELPDQREPVNIQNVSPSPATDPPTAHPVRPAIPGPQAATLRRVTTRPATMSTSTTMGSRS